MEVNVAETDRETTNEMRGKHVTETSQTLTNEDETKARRLATNWQDINKNESTT